MKLHYLTLPLALGLTAAADAQTIATSRSFIGRPLMFEYTSIPGHGYHLFGALPPAVSIPVPGVLGALRLNPQTITPLFPGTVPITAIDHRQIFVPNLPGLIGAKIDFQVLDIAPNRLALSNATRVELEAAPPRPNVVLIMADDLGYGTLSSYGGSWVSTPNIDSIGLRGARFTDGYVTGGTCSPSRAGLLTGRYQQRFGFEFNAGDLQRTIDNPIGLDPAETTIADLARGAGYVTGMCGKWHQGVQPQYWPNARGFDQFYGMVAGALCYLPCSQRGNPVENSIFRDTTPIQENRYLTDAFASESVAFIEQHKDEQFFLYVPFNAVHTPLEATQKYLSRFLHINDPDMRKYLAMTSALDDAVGDILAALRDNDLERDTIVVFSSDNGAIPEFQQNIAANAPLRFGKGTLFEGGVRVPMLLQWPAVVPGGTVYTEPVSTLDVFATVRAAIGASPPARPLDGVDLVPHLTGHATTAPHELLFWRNGPDTLAVRAGPWKLIRSIQGSEWLYDLDTDIGETNNLASQRQDVVQALTAVLDAWSAGLQLPAWTSRATHVFMIDGQPYLDSV